MSILIFDHQTLISMVYYFLEYREKIIFKSI